MQKLLEFLYKFRWYVLIVVLAVVAASTFLSFSLKNQIADLIAQKKEAERPAEIGITRITTPECNQCEQMMKLVERVFSRLNLVFIEERSVSFGSQEAQRLIEEFQIEKVPALILTGEIEKTDQLKQALSSMGEKIKDSVVISGLRPPYVEVSTNNIVGKFKIIYLTDENCRQCYNVNVHKNILASFGMFPFDEVSVDKESQEGKQLIVKYNITKVPTILLQGDLELYPGFQRVWENVGKITSDNTYVFEAVSQMGTYYDLSQDKIIESNQRQN